MWKQLFGAKPENTSFPKGLTIKADRISSKYFTGDTAKTFTINQGDIVYITGESGSGKTVLLKILSGYEKNINGALTFEASNCHELTWQKDDNTLKKLVGFVPQDAILYKNINVGKLLMYYNSIFGCGLKEDNIKGILKKLNIDQQWGKEISKLSGGQQKRVSLAVELIRNPAVLLLDEPDSGLDKENREALYGLLGEMSCKRTTVVLTSHYEYDDKLDMERFLLRKYA